MNFLPPTSSLTTPEVLGTSISDKGRIPPIFARQVHDRFNKPACVFFSDSDKESLLRTQIKRVPISKIESRVLMSLIGPMDFAGLRENEQKIG